MVVRASRRLPGFRFEVQPPPPTDVLPRMDVAVFVGFAESGPLHMPVAVEDAAQFQAIFGNDVPLAWDRARSETVYAYLAPAVRAFFRNGGLRCWVIRVAGEQAQYNYFPVPGLALVEMSNGSDQSDADGGLTQTETGLPSFNITPAFTRARSPGSWSDAMRVGVVLASHPVRVADKQPLDQKSLVIDLAVDSPNDIAVGDLLCLTFIDEGYVLMFAVQSVVPIDPSSLGSPPMTLMGRSMLKVTGRMALWFKTNLLSSPPLVPIQAVLFANEGPKQGIHVYLHPPAVQSPTTFESVTLDLEISLPDAPEPGSLIRVDAGAEQLWLTVQSVHLLSSAGSPPADTVQVQVQGQGLWVVQTPPDSWPGGRMTAEKLTFELQARQGDDLALRLSDLAFSTDHPRFWKALPTDEQLYRDAEVTSTPAHSILSRTVDVTPYQPLWQDAANPRFPVAGSDVVGDLYVPIAMPLLPGTFLGRDKGLQGPALPRARDGLEEFNVNFFLDWDMIEVLTQDVMMQADFLRYQSPDPRNLRGIHAALSITEASIIAVPDVIQRGWTPAAYKVPPPQPSQPRDHPEERHCQADMPKESIAGAPANTSAGDVAQQTVFHNCVTRFDPPELYVVAQPDVNGTFTLRWSTADDPGAEYILEESLSSDWSEAAEIYRGAEGELVVYGRGQGDYYYRVRVEVNGVSSDWSSGVVVSVVPTGRWELLPEAGYDAEGLIALQRALVRMCAARGDLLAVLAVPEHYRENDVVAHIATLKAPLGRAIPIFNPDIVPGGSPMIGPTGDDQSGDIERLVLPLGFGERLSFTYGALYHPWLFIREEDVVNATNRTNEIRRMPPEGVATGIMALRAIARGAWIAPANELLHGVVALTPQVGRGYWQSLQDAQVNLIRQEPRGFLALSADTLADEEDADVRPINVRRLLSLLRRLALRLGATYVFEPNGDAFRRLVQRGFEAMLDGMFLRGAFAGSTPATSFQVVIDTSLNTSQSVDLGRFIVELRVAPSLPMTFLTIRLVQSGVSGTVTEG